MRCDACRGVVDEQESTKYSAQQVKLLEASQKIVKVPGLQLPQAHPPDNTMMTDLLNAAVFGLSPEEASKNGVRSNMQSVWAHYQPKAEPTERKEFFVCPSCAKKLDNLAHWKRIACPQCSKETIRAGYPVWAKFIAFCFAPLFGIGLLALLVGRKPTVCQYCGHTWKTK